MGSRTVVIVVLLSLVVAACDGAEAPQVIEPGPTAAESPSPSGTQQLVVGAPEDTFVTEGEKANLGMFPINANIFETLVLMTPDFQLEPGLATSWEYRGNDTWRFELREGVTFHDGQPFDAEAAVSSFQRLATAYGPRLSIGPDSAQAVDDVTVDVTTTATNLSLPSQLVHPSIAPMIAPGTDVGTEPVGTGPFRFVEYVPQERLVVERNPDYWGDQARLETLTFRFIPDGNTRWLSLRTGDVDLIYDLPRELLSEVEQTAGIKAGFEPGETPAGSSEIMLLNRGGTPPYTILQEQRVRQALGHAIDREGIVKEIWADAAEVNDTVTPETLFGEHASIVEGPDYDRSRAEQLLDEAGWIPGADGIRSKDGQRLQLTMINGYPPIDIRKPMPEIVQAQLRDVGVEVDIVETPEFGTYSERLDNGEGDIFLERVAQNDATPSFFAAAFFYSQASGPYAKWFAAGQDFDSLVEEAQAVEDRDLAKKKSAEAMSIAVDDSAVVIPVAATYWLFMMKDDVQGFVPHGSARHVRWASVYRGS
ncbi:MAG: ABC transporter substrate-binding protein [Actinomycetota bacterium]|nr:ABC transporter substrate-binding protein [Actinomycetota bacterium]